MKNKILLGLSLISIFIGAALVSCSRPADGLQSEVVPVGSHVFTTPEVVEMLQSNGVSCSFTLTDKTYIAPEADWVKSQFSSKFTKFLFDYNINHWTQESNDCDDISRAAATYASILYGNSKNRIKGHGFLFGEYHYAKAGAGGHAINVAIVKDGEEYRLMFYEPQVKYEVTLSESEKFNGSIWLRF